MLRGRLHCYNGYMSPTKFMFKYNLYMTYT